MGNLNRNLVADAETPLSEQTIGKPFKFDGPGRPFNS